MKIELIPVIEIVPNQKEIKMLDKFPYWENTELWKKYYSSSFEQNRFQDKLLPYRKGFPFYEINKITDRNLKKIIIDHTKELRNGEYEREQASCLFGGYVLRVDNVDKYFPQCCGDLGDIKYWGKISKGENLYYEGHPAPKVKFKSKKIIFDFSVNKYNEKFEPTPNEIIVEVDKSQLVIAVQKAKQELKNLAKRIIQINNDNSLGIERIDDLLIWENPNHL